ncbi:STAS domain-containing protein [Streptomyces sp. NPDC017943]|uniref:STAS domain-containing protein n=1 Tax=Streptomyces sp. NPDC017943 TaxID=3365019 RepID=UPI0037B92086
MTPSQEPEAHEPISPAEADTGSLLPTGPSLTLVSRRGPRHAVVAVTGPLDYHTTPQLLGHLTTKEMQEVPLLLLDLDQVDFCDSSALGAFVALHRGRIEAGHGFGLTGLQPEVLRILELTRLTTVLPLYATVDEALSA